MGISRSVSFWAGFLSWSSQLWDLPLVMTDVANPFQRVLGGKCFADTEVIDEQTYEPVVKLLLFRGFLQEAFNSAAASAG